MLRRALSLALALCAIPVSAAHADVFIEGDVVYADTDAGTALVSTVRQTSPTTVVFGPDGGVLAGLTPRPLGGCTAAAGEITCVATRPVVRIDVRSGARLDALRVGTVTSPLRWSGGGDFDVLSAGPAGTGTVTMRVSLDDVANDTFDGSAGSDVRADVEDVRGADGADVLTGSPGPNDLAGGAGNDQLDGGGGYDVYDAGPGDDVIDARDGLAELVDCGAGNDHATLDASDEPVGCETVVADGTLGPDLDGDGVRTPADCDDTNPAVRPGAVEIPDNRLDDDCAGGDASDPDRDRDGVPRPADCDDTRADIRPGVPEIPGNGVDDDCDDVQAPYPSSRVSLRQATGASALGTRFLVLKLTKLRRGDLIRVACRGRGCPFPTRAFRAPAAGGTLDLRRRAFRDRRLRPGGRVTITVTNARDVTKRFAFEMRKAEAPVYVIRCASPPDNRLRRC
jgi:hypothetical protein